MNRRHLVVVVMAVVGCATAHEQASMPAHDAQSITIAASPVRLGTTRFLQRDPIASLAFSSDGSSVAAGDVSGRVVLWDVASGTSVRRFDGLNGAAATVSLSSDGGRVAAMTVDMHWAVWDTANGRLLFRDREPEAGSLHCAATWSRDGSRLALGAAKTLLVDGRDGRVVSRWEHGVIGVTWALAFSPDGALLAEGDYGVRVLDAATAKVVAELRDPTPRMSFNALACAVFVSDDATVVEAILGSGVALRRDGHAAPIRRIEVATGDIGASAIAPDGATFAVTGSDGLVRVFDWARSIEIARFAPAGVGVHAIAFSPDARIIATGGGEGRVRLWNAADGVEIEPAPGHAGPVLAIATSPDGVHVATAGRDGSVRLWNARTAREERVLLREIGPVHAVAFSSDGRLVAAGGWERKVTVLDAGTGQARSISQTPEDVRAIRFGADGVARAVAASVPACPPGHTDRVTSSSPVDGGRFLISASWDGSIRLWNVASGLETGRIDAGTEVNALAVSPDESIVWAGLSDGTTVGWPIAALSVPRPAETVDRK